MEEQEQLLIGELAKRAGVTPRTIRYYAGEGLLPPPAMRGKYATYGPEHLRQLALIARLKADYLPLGAIRQRLDSMGQEEADRLLSSSRGEAGPVQGSPSGWRADRSHAGGLASRLAERGARYELPGASPPPMLQAGRDLAADADPFRLAPSLPIGRVEFFPERGEAGPPEAHGGPAAVAPELWRHYALAPGVELRISESLPPRRRRQVEALLAALRDRLLSEEE